MDVGNLARDVHIETVLLDTPYADEENSSSGEGDNESAGGGFLSSLSASVEDMTGGARCVGANGEGREGQGRRLASGG